jgi:hypothetical protein
MLAFCGVTAAGQPSYQGHARLPSRDSALMIARTTIGPTVLHAFPFTQAGDGRTYIGVLSRRPTSGIYDEMQITLLVGAQDRYTTVPLDTGLTAAPGVGANVLSVRSTKGGGQHQLMWFEWNGGSGGETVELQRFDVASRHLCSAKATTTYGQMKAPTLEFSPGSGCRQIQPFLRQRLRYLVDSLAEITPVHTSPKPQ